MIRETITIKGTRRGLVILVQPGLHLEEIKSHLLAKMEAARGFFKGAVFSFAPDPRIGPEQLRELQAICRRYGMIPASQQSSPPQTAVSGPRHNLPRDGEPALLVGTSLRSGQYVVYHGHVVVLGGVHPGAVVRAGGDVIVVGTCRGTVDAGVSHGPGARIVAGRLLPDRMTIAGVAWEGTTAEKANGYYDTAYLSEGRVILQPGNAGL